MTRVPSDKDHARAQDSLLSGVKETFPNASETAIREFAAPILDRARREMADDASKPKRVDDSVRADAFMPASAKGVSESLAQHVDGVEVSAIEKRQLGTLSLDDVSTTPAPQKHRTEEERAIAARTRALLDIPAWRKRLEDAIQDSSPEKMTKVIVDSDAAFGDHLDCYRKAVAMAKAQIEAGRRTLARGRLVLS